MKCLRSKLQIGQWEIKFRIMANNFYLESVERIDIEGEVETLLFTNGVNLLTGEPNAGKSTWVRQIDFVLGKEANVMEMFVDPEVSKKYQKIILKVIIADQEVEFSRAPLDVGLATKIFINETPYSPSEFSQEILKLLSIPSDIKYPKGNPYTTQWVSLGFRSLYRHLYRKEDGWGDLADKQPISEQFASQFLLLGIADKLYSKESSSTITKQKRLTELESRKEQFTELISQVAKEMSSKETFMTNSINARVLGEMINDLNKQLNEIQLKRDDILRNRLEKIESTNKEFEINLSASRAKYYQERDEVSKHIAQFQKKVKDFSEIHTSIIEEISKIKRTKKSGIISEMRVTHCPACDQNISADSNTVDSCFLCKQSTIGINTKKSNRLDFEIEQLSNEQNELFTILHDHKKIILDLQQQEKSLTERIFSLDKNIEEIKRPLYALNDNELSEIDISKGRILEQILNYGRLIENYKYKEELELKINALEKEIEQENLVVEKENASINFETVANDLSKGMQDYIDKIVKVNPKVWTRGRRIEVSLTESKITFYVNNTIWTSLGGLDKQLFLLAYHYGLINLSYRPKYNIPAFTIIDLPPDLGRAVETSYNYLITPFIELTNRMKLKDLKGQVIIVGRAFKGIKDVHEIQLETVW